jgi:hypothetical protein
VRLLERGVCQGQGVHLGGCGTLACAFSAPIVRIIVQIINVKIDLFLNLW